MADQNVYVGNCLVISDDSALEIDYFDPNVDLSRRKFYKGFAYVYNDYFYSFHGEVRVVPEEPGIYYCKGHYEWVPVYREADKKKYALDAHITNISLENIVQVLKTKEDLYISLPENPKLFIPAISAEDDILKRAIKSALLEKNIDIDQYKHRFVDKNALFNFKQVVKGSSKLSMMLFERGCQALNLKYTIIIEELDPDTNIGLRLDNPIVVSSEDTYPI